MADIYVNLNLATSGASGSIGDPLGYNEFMSQINSGITSDTTFKIEGTHYYDSGEYFRSICDPNLTIIFESKGNEPPTIGYKATDDASVSNFFLIDGASSCNIQLRGLMLEVDSNGHDIGTTKLFGSGASINSSWEFENCLFLMSAITGSQFCYFVDGYEGATQVIMKGCTFANLGPGTLRAAIEFVNQEFNNSSIDSCYFEGPMQYVFRCDNLSNPFGGSFDYCGFYNMTGLTSLTLGTNVPSAGTHNVGNGSGSSQLTGLGLITDMTLPGDLRPIAGSPIRKAANPALGLGVDLFGISRTGISDIGAVVIPSSIPMPPYPPRNRKAPVFNRPVQGRSGSSRGVYDRGGPF